MIPKALSRHKFRVIAGGVLLLIGFNFVTLRKPSFGVAVFNDLDDGRVENPLEDIKASIPESDKSSFNILPVDPGSKEAHDAGIQNPQDQSKPIPDSIVSSIRDYSIFFDEFSNHMINAESLKKNYKSEAARELFHDNKDFLFSKEYLENVLNIAETTFTQLKDSHQRYVKHLHSLVDEVGVSTFGNIRKSDDNWKQYEGSKGFVLIGGSQYSWLSYLVIRQIRAVGSTLPIELFIPNTGEYEAEFCEKILPKYNAYCNMLDSKLSTIVTLKYGIGGYQYKMLALLSSKFENVIYLDSDNFPVRNPEYILESEVYKDTGLILWPDAWARTTNPKFYDIAGVSVREKKISYNAYDKAQGERPLDQYSFKDAWYHTFEGTLPDPSSETGMLVINKTKHLKTLLLTLYYNILGPNYYYPLMTQGSAGEGDKETFIAAAHVLQLPWFQTLKTFRWVGYFHEETEEFTSKALGHYNPVESQNNPEADLDFVFMHLSYPKYFPNWLVDNHDLVYAQLGNHIRMYKDIYDNVGYDFDLRVMQFFTQALCKEYYDENGAAIDGSGVTKEEFMGPYLGYVGEDAAEDKQCTEVFIPHLKWLKETTKDKAPE